MTAYYKWLDGRKSCNGGNAAWQKGRWKTVRGSLVPCENGLHLCREQDLLTWAGPSLWLAEVDDSELIDHGDKVVVRRARIVEQLAWDDRIVRLFAADCAERTLPIYEKWVSGDDRPRTAIQAARAFANGDISAAARAAARDAAWDAARDAAWDEREWQTTRLLDYAHGRIT